VEFFQADLLELDTFAPEFDVVYSQGVLHHLRDPKAGLAVLARQAKPGGLVKIALYSQLGRADVNAARELIARRNVPATPEGIRAFRQEILREDAHSPLASLLRSRDFFSMSECRDLLFHVQESQFDLPAIARMLEELGLISVGLSRHAERAAVLAYRELFPGDHSMTDLMRWHAVEARHPELFRGMYPVWCRVPG
jgi:SAM-dependent methyltransferase